MQITNCKSAKGGGRRTGGSEALKFSGYKAEITVFIYMAINHALLINEEKFPSKEPPVRRPRLSLQIKPKNL